MAYKSSTDGGYGAGSSVIHGDHSLANSIIVPDAELLFRGQFQRSGPDLILTGQDGHRHTVPGYFANPHHPTLVAPNGAKLAGDVVDLLAGSHASDHYAQAQAMQSLPPDAIGRVEKVVGVVTVLRNGVSVAVHVGDAIFKADVIQTASDSSCGVGFPDGTALNVVGNSRMALNDYAFDANSNANGALFTLVEGTFAFVAGQVAHTGDMRIATPVATMGIRGTTGILGTSNLGEVYFVLQDDYHTTHHGTLELLEFGIFINDTTSATYCSASSCRTEPLTTAQVNQFHQLTDQLGQLINLMNNPNPQMGPSPGSGDNPNLLLPIMQLLQENGGRLLFGNVNFNGGQSNSDNNTNGLSVVPVTLLENTQPTLASNIFIWNGGLGTWDTPSWNQPNAVPSSPGDTVEILVGSVNYNSDFTIANLIVGQGAALNIVGGTLTVLNSLQDSGTITVTGDPPVVTVEGTATIATGSGFTISGAGNTLVFDGPVSNFGTLDATQGGGIVFNGSSVVNAASGVIEADGVGSTVDPTSITLDNFGMLLATHHGEITFSQSLIVNEAGGVIEAKHHGVIELDEGAVANDQGGVIKSVGWGSQVELNNDLIANSGSIEARHGGEVLITNSELNNNQFGLLSADGNDSKIEADFGVINNSSVVEASGGGYIAITSSEYVGGSLALLLSDGYGSTIAFSDDGIYNLGAIVADDAAYISFGTDGVTNYGVVNANSFGGILFWESWVSNGGTIEATDGGSLWIEHTPVNNTDSGANDGSIKADGLYSTIYLDDADIIGGTIGTSGGAIVQVTDDATSIFDGSELFNGNVLALTLYGEVNVQDGSALELIGTINDKGLIVIDAGSDSDPDLIIDGKVNLGGGGDVVLSGNGADIIGALGGQPNILVNIDDTISGGGFVGGNDLSIDNERHGVIDANGSDPLVIDTGSNAIVNDGLMEASYGSELVLDSKVANTGLIFADGGTVKIDAGLTNFGGLLAVDNHGTLDVCGTASGGCATIAGGTLIFEGASDVNTTFACGPYGTLVLDSPLSFAGLVNGFAGINFTNSDEIDLLGINASDVCFQQDGHNAEIIIKTGATTFTEITLTDVDAKDLRATSGAGGTVIYDTDSPSGGSPWFPPAGNKDSFSFNEPPPGQPGNSGPSDPGHTETNTAPPAHDWWALVGDPGHGHGTDGHPLPDVVADHWQQIVHHSFPLH